MTTLTNERLEKVAQGFPFDGDTEVLSSGEVKSIASELISLRAQLAELWSQTPFGYVVEKRNRSGVKVFVENDGKCAFSNNDKITQCYKNPVPQAVSQPVSDWKDEFAGACQTLAKITELLDIPEDDVDGEPLQIFEAIEALKQRAIQSGNSPAYPETLPCPVLLEPGMRISKGCPTTTLFLALNSRAATVAALEAMTPEERKEHDAAIEEFKVMLGIGSTNAPVSPDSSVPKILSDAVRDVIAERQRQISDPRRDLVKSVALIIAEIERIDRQNKIQPMKPERDEYGCWTHPRYLEFCDDREFIPRNELDEWASSMGMQWEITHLETDISSRLNQSVNRTYFDDGNPDVSDWVPYPPDGAGWFIISIHDTEDGPVCIWLRENA